MATDYEKDIIELMGSAWRLSERADHPKYKLLLDFIGNLLEDTLTTSFDELEPKDFILQTLKEMDQD